MRLLLGHRRASGHALMLLRLRSRAVQAADARAAGALLHPLERLHLDLPLHGRSSSRICSGTHSERLQLRLRLRLRLRLGLLLLLPLLLLMLRRPEG